MSATLVRVVVLVAALVGVAHAEKKKAGLFDFETWKSPVSRERDAAKQLAPTSLDLTPAAVEGETKTIRLRLYAERDYRSLVLRWQGKLRAQIQNINAVVTRVFAVRFEIESVRDWDRSHVGQPLERVLEELETLDPAREVDLVVGFATPLQGVAASVHQIGTSRLLARHFVLRGMDDEQELRAFERELKLISSEERQRLYGERKAHKEVVMFLHEWGHALGLLHNDDPTVIMNPAYDPRQAGFSDFEKKVVALVVGRRAARPNELYPETADLLPLLAAAPHDEGSDKDRADLLAFARARVQPGTPNGGGATIDLSEDDVAAFNRAVAAANAGKREEGWAALAPVFAHARAGKVAPETWARLATLAVGVGALSAAEDALSHAGGAGDTTKLAAEVESTRYRLALPVAGAKVGVPPEREPAYVAAFWEVVAATGDPSAERS
ncbi:MAG TPA: matrixin family metalloprotease, partial [Streptosporangiaceae bacterium]|nr:matrixin family metalloprotease [Streptosporangiaceae bacterium]